MARCFVGKHFTGCPSCADEAALKNEQAASNALTLPTRLGRAGIPERFQDRRVSTYEVSTPGQQAVVDFARSYIRDFPNIKRRGKSALFLGRPGTGKTHIACAIANATMREHGTTSLFITAARAVRLVKDTWGKGSQISESQAISLLVRPDLLVLDEVGVQTGSEFEQNLIFDVLNERYEMRKPCLLLSNENLETVTSYLGARVMDRMKEDGARVFAFSWESYRTKLGAQE